MDIECGRCGATAYHLDEGLCDDCKNELDNEEDPGEARLTALNDANRGLLNSFKNEHEYTEN